MTQKIIGFIGNIGSGKSTSAQYLQSILPNSIVVSFADELKRIAKELGWDGNKDELGRHFLQNFGELCKRDIDNYIWIKKLDFRIKNELSEYDYIIIDDVRFNSEHYFIKNNYDCYFIKILKNKNIFNFLNIFSHISERELLKLEYDIQILNNTKCFNDLFDNIDFISKYFI